MSLATPLRKYTAADLLTMPDGDRYELVDGELVEIETSAESSWIAGEFHAVIRNYAKAQRLGWAFPDSTGYQCFSWEENRIRKPDASFVSLKRLPEGPPATGYLSVAPDLVVEVISPHDLYYDVERKTLEYLRAGVRMVWVVTPSTRTVMVHRSDVSSPTHLTDTAELTGDPVLPGFRCRVADLFPPHPTPVSR